MGAEPVSIPPDKTLDEMTPAEVAALSPEELREVFETRVTRGTGLFRDVLTANADLIRDRDNLTNGLMDIAALTSPKACSVCHNSGRVALPPVHVNQPILSGGGYRCVDCGGSVADRIEEDVLTMAAIIAANAADPEVCECRSCRDCDGEGSGTRYHEPGCSLPSVGGIRGCPGHEWECAKCGATGKDKRDCPLHGLED